MAPCSNNEILKASVTYNHTAQQKGKERKRGGQKTQGGGKERQKERTGPSTSQIGIEETQPQPSTRMTLFLLLRAILGMATLGRFLAVSAHIVLVKWNRKGAWRKGR